MHHTIQYRIRNRNDNAVDPKGPVVYWMQRDQRVVDNWALYYTYQQARERQVPIIIVFNLVPRFGNATHRHFDFMIAGLKEVNEQCKKLNIPFIILTGEPTETIPAFVKKYAVGELVVDQNPLRFTDTWRREVADKISIACTEVDAHNIVPVWYVSDKQEFAAHTFRPKIHRQLASFLTSIPSIAALSSSAGPDMPEVDWSKIEHSVEYDKSVAPVTWLTPGTAAGMQTVHDFIDSRSEGYATSRNDPNKDSLSNLSPYLHFGQISAQAVAYLVQHSDMSRNDKESFLEELIVRRELADNFCFYNPYYDTLQGAHEWAQKTLTQHRDDKREYVYTLHEFEQAETHDELWNAMQWQMIKTGKLHGWCRMYWAKKILEWTNTPEYAIKVALYLNDRYELDGTDPNGVVGVMWSIAGVHDRAWTERPVFGKIRYMNFSGAKRKFDVRAYIDRYEEYGPNLFKT